MKKSISLLLALSIPLSTCTTSFAYQEANGVVLNGVEIPLHTKPIIKDGRTLVPARDVLEKLGFNVTWNDSTRTVISEREDSRIELAIDSALKGNKYNDFEIELDVPATIVNDKTFIPIRVVSELVKLDVQWDSLNKKALITDMQNPNVSFDKVYDVLNESKAEQFEKEVIRLTNIEREKIGLSPLKSDALLLQVARLKSEDMSSKKYFDHTSPTYGSPFDMMDTFNVVYGWAGENIAMGQTSPEQVVNSWMSSDGHRKNILNPNFDTIGVGYAEGDIWTQMFISEK